jgi:hypothetical protein
MITIRVDFVPTQKYGDNSATLLTKEFEGENFFDACQKIAEFMKRGIYETTVKSSMKLKLMGPVSAQPWLAYKNLPVGTLTIKPKLNCLWEGELDAKTPEGLHISPDVFIGGDRDSWGCNPLFLEAIKSFL